jgi:hypothetical protein
MPTTAPQAKRCPNCDANLPINGRRCTVCKLEFSQMPAFAAAKRAAQQKGLNSTQIISPSAPWWRTVLRPNVLIPAILLILALYYFTRPAPPPPWAAFPPTRLDAAQKFLADIASGQDAGFDRAYALISPSVHDPQLDDEIGHYRQLFYVMYSYLSGEFGDDWGKNATLELDPKDPNVIIAHVDVETLHLRMVEQTPPAKLTPTNHHWALAGVDEFDVHDSGKYLKMAGIKGVLRGEAGQGAVNNLESIIGAMGGGLHETHMQTKIRLLPLLHNPRTVNKYEVFQTWPVRKDPVIRRRLQAIVDDGRYNSEIQDIAKRVLNDSITDEELIAAHVNDN